jgi:hypothetical protein
METASDLQLVLPAAMTARFSGLLQRGVTLPIQAGCSVYALLTQQLGVEPEYVATRITTVFLDGQVVDALDTAYVRDGARLALSAALPGLVGATLRRGGAYAAMRGEITRPVESRGESLVASAKGTASVKLFNLLIAELGPVLLGHGILLEQGEAKEVLGGWCDQAAGLGAGNPVRLRVKFV